MASDGDALDRRDADILIPGLLLPELLVENKNLFQIIGTFGIDARFLQI